PSFDLLNLPRPKSREPWAYVKIAEGCDRNCGFCAIPSFRGPQRSRDIDSILREVDELHAKEIVLVAQDLASYGKDRPGELGAGSIVPLVRAVSAKVPRTRLLYLYPSDLTDELIEAILASGVPYFDLSLQHVSKPHLRRMRRWGDGERFLKRIADIRSRDAQSAFRSNFIVGYPGETEDDHDQLLAFVHEASLDWCGFFTNFLVKKLSSQTRILRVADDLPGYGVNHHVALDDAVRSLIHICCDNAQHAARDRVDHVVANDNAANCFRIGASGCINAGVVWLFSAVHARVRPAQERGAATRGRTAACRRRSGLETCCQFTQSQPVFIQRRVDCSADGGVVVALGQQRVVVCGLLQRCLAEDGLIKGRTQRVGSRLRGQPRDASGGTRGACGALRILLCG
ncbi:MAG: radical SAM protein, partial [Betaproteobacteria bacterium]|nr:radical SAM protein [Betaproteobacteria bacterium]